MTCQGLASYSETCRGITVEVKPFYVPEQSFPSSNLFFYAYAITITNFREFTVQLLKRSWIIKNGMGTEERVEGDGVVGTQPCIKPFESFKYASFCPLQTPYGNMRGRYQMIDPDSRKFWVRAPLFFFRPPTR